MIKIDKIIFKGRIIVFYGSILFFIFGFILLYKMEIDIIISISVAAISTFFYYLLSSSYWFISNIQKTNNGHELIEQALFYGIITINKKDEEPNLLFITNEYRIKWDEVKLLLKNQNKSYYLDLPINQKITISASLKNFNLLSLIFLLVSSIEIIYGIYENNILWIFFGLILMGFGIFFSNLKKDKNIKIVLDEDGIKIDDTPKMFWNKIKNENIKFLSNGEFLYFDYENRTICIKLQFYEGRPFEIFNQFRYFKYRSESIKIENSYL
jgi:hypothetical protein